jgi:hypothetical protein
VLMSERDIIERTDSCRSNNFRVERMLVPECYKSRKSKMNHPPVLLSQQRLCFLLV